MLVPVYQVVGMGEVGAVAGWGRAPLHQAGADREEREMLLVLGDELGDRLQVAVGVDVLLG